MPSFTLFEYSSGTSYVDAQRSRLRHMKEVGLHAAAAIGIDEMLRAVISPSNGAQIFSKDCISADSPFERSTMEFRSLSQLTEVELNEASHRSAWRNSRLSLARARDTWAFTVTSATPRTRAASLMVIPSRSRRRNALPNEGGSSSMQCMRCPCSSDFMHASSGLSVRSTNLSDTQYPGSSPNCSSSDTWIERGRLRNCVRAELITIVVNQVDIFDCPLN
jgi:hypothetical protein